MFITSKNTSWVIALVVVETIFNVWKTCIKKNLHAVTIKFPIIELPTYFEMKLQKFCMNMLK